MTKDKMISEIIEKNGFEHPLTIWFCKFAEILTTSQLEKIFWFLMKWGLTNSIPYDIINTE